MPASVFTFAPSRLLAFLYAAAAVCCAGGVAVAELPLWIQAGTIAIIAVCFGLAARAHALLRHKNSVVRLRFMRDWRIMATLAGGGDRECRVRTLFSSPLVCTAKLQAARGRYFLAVAGDSLPPDDFRRCRMMFKLAMAAQNALAQGDKPRGQVAAFLTGRAPMAAQMAAAVKEMMAGEAAREKHRQEFKEEKQ